MVPHEAQFARAQSSCGWCGPFAGLIVPTDIASLTTVFVLSLLFVEAFRL